MNCKVTAFTYGSLSISYFILTTHLCIKIVIFINRNNLYVPAADRGGDIFQIFPANTIFIAIRQNSYISSVKRTNKGKT